jgi:hypothetical protein
VSKHSEENRVAIDVLIRFLSSGLLDVKGDDAKLEKLQTTAADLSAALKKTLKVCCICFNSF